MVEDDDLPPLPKLPTSPRHSARFRGGRFGHLVPHGRGGRTAVAQGRGVVRPVPHAAGPVVGGSNRGGHGDVRGGARDLNGSGG